MPYSGPEDKALPSNVKKLGAKQRRQWVNVFNSAHSRCQAKGGKDCEAFAFKNANGVLKNASTTFAGLLGGEHPLGRAFIELQAADPPETVNVFPAPGTYKHPLWGDIEVAEESNQQFVDNFNSQVYQEHVPIDAEHETKLSGAVGYIKKLSMNDDGSIEADVEWTARGAKLIEEDSYKYISPEWYETWTDPATAEEYENVLIGAALTTRPFFKGLRSLVASEGRLYDLDPATEERELVACEMAMPYHKSPRIAELARNLGVLAEMESPPAEAIRALLKEMKQEVQAGSESDADQEVMYKNHRKQDASVRNLGKKEASMTVKVDEIDVTKLDKKEQDTLFRRLGRAWFGHEDNEEGGGDGDEDKDEHEEEVKSESEGESEKGIKDGVPVTAAEITSLRGSLTKERQAREAAEKRLAGLEATERTRRYRDVVLGRDEASVRQAQETNVALHPMVGDHAGKLHLMETLALTKGEDSAEFTSYVAMEREHARQLHSAGLFAASGTDSHGEPASTDAISEFERRAKALMAGEKAISQDEAYAKIAQEDPKLYDAYDRAVTGRKGRYVGMGS